MNFFRRYSFFIILMITVVVASDFMAQNDYFHTKLYGFEKTMATVSKPIGWSFQKFFGSIKSIYQNYFQLVDIKSKYLQLEQENTKLQAQLHIFESVLQENQKLKTILDFKENNQFDFLVGKIIGYDPSFTFNSIKINLGKQNGIQPGMGAVSSEGVIGIVIRVQAKTCDVLLLTDPNSNIDSIITRNQSRGILQGKLASTMRFKYFDRNINVWVGDKIVTSGLTGAFPANIPIGTVTNIQKTHDDLSQIVEVEPAVNIVKLTDVLILKNTDPAIEIMRNAAGADWIDNIMNTSTLGKKDESE